MAAGTAMGAVGHDGAHAGTHPAKDATREYLKAMDAMHGPMMEGVTDPDPDAAFARGMLWHHKGAVDMAKIQLKYGKDPEMRKLAQDILNGQEPEIRLMETWLQKRKTPGTAR